ncbi:type II toxin-antitoxin system RelE/ParE family toxin [Sphingomonas endolithica]|uniref:type II toxin-antitoxin system RelE/ParE family toxin n=1 Tax=Sphingomonas endolithica TaxID=2972485 RepID=UPI003AB0582A
MARIVWSRAALISVNDIREYIRQFDPSAAERVATQLLAAGESLRDFPNRGALRDDGCRTLPSVQPYSIIYDVVGDTVNVLEVRHAARAPREFGPRS